MKVTGTIINYYFHCKRQCWLFGNRINLEDNSEDVQIGRVLHEINYDQSKCGEVSIENIKVDKITKDYLVEVKKSDSDTEAVIWQLLLYLKTLKDKGIYRKGKIEFVEKNKSNNRIIYRDLTEKDEGELDRIASEIEELLLANLPPKAEYDVKCKKCAYYEYCYI